MSHNDETKRDNLSQKNAPLIDETENRMSIFNTLLSLLMSTVNSRFFLHHTVKNAIIIDKPSKKGSLRFICRKLIPGCKDGK